MSAPQDVNQMNEHVIKLLSTAANVRDPAEDLLTKMLDDRVQRNNVVAWMSHLMVQSSQQEVPQTPYCTPAQLVQLFFLALYPLAHPPEGCDLFPGVRTAT